MYGSVLRLTGLGLLGVLALASAGGAGGRAHTDAFKRSRMCGPNSIFMFLLLCGADPTEDSIDSIPVADGGSSFADLIAHAERFGVPVEVRKYTPADLLRVRLPAICQTSGALIGDRMRHFLVAYDVDSAGLWVLDGTDGSRHRLRRDRIADYLSGYALVRKPTFSVWMEENQGWFTAILLVASLPLLAALARARSGGRRRRGFVRLPAGGHDVNPAADSRPGLNIDRDAKLFNVRIFWMILVVIVRGSYQSSADTGPTSAPSGEPPGVVWRGERFGGLNCLLFLSYIYGNTATYGDCVNSLGADPPPNDGAEILRAAKRLGFPLEARALSPKELDAVQLPVIVHLDGDRPGEGLFYVLLGRNSSLVCLMEGPRAIVLNLDKEVFLRRWSGVVIHPKRWRFPVIPVCVALFFSISFILAWVVPRRPKVLVLAAAILGAGAVNAAADRLLSS